MHKIDFDLNTVTTDNFNEVYFDIHEFMYKYANLVTSRNGNTKELLNFKTQIHNPISRCVGGFNRNMNVFFLLAESLWIWAGKKDVSFLDMFNSKLKQYSDDGVSYHAPYGFRLRKYGLHSYKEQEYEPIDQIAKCLSMLSVNPDDRRVVAQIWNAEFDLGTDSKDLPCNDMIMWKIRNGKLYTTIQNRSNDLNLGLTTNVFQFSIVSEIMARILGVEVGYQVHNSQSLHIYMNEQTDNLQQNIMFNKNTYKNIYDEASETPMIFNFYSNNVNERLHIVDFYVNNIINELIYQYNNKSIEDSSKKQIFEDLRMFCPTLHFIYELLSLYIKYKNKLIDKMTCLLKLHELSIDTIYSKSDLIALANNFFASRLKQDELSVLSSKYITSKNFGTL